VRGPIPATDIESFVLRRLLAPVGLVWIIGAGCAGVSKTPVAEGNLAAADASAGALDATEGRTERIASEDDTGTGVVSTAPIDRSDGGAPAMEAPVTDEIPYPPGSRIRLSGAVAASSEDEAIARWNRGGTSAGEAPPTPGGKVPHPAPRIKVDVLKVSGHVSEAEVLRQARSKGYWPFRLCYEEGLRRSQKMHGTVHLRITIGSNGAVRGAQKVAAEVDDPTVVGCIVKAARGLSLPAPERGMPSVTLEVSLWPGDDSVHSSVSTEGKKPRASDTAALLTALRAHLPEVRSCFAEGQKRHPGLWGRIGMRLRIRAAGEIVDASEIESRFPDPEVTFCVLKAFAHSDVPAPREELIIVYPLRLGALPELREELKP
jgi:hypothetical protein